MSLYCLKPNQIDGTYEQLSDLFCTLYDTNRDGMVIQAGEDTITFYPVRKLAGDHCLAETTKYQIFVATHDNAKIKKIYFYHKEKKEIITNITKLFSTVDHFLPDGFSIEILTSIDSYFRTFCEGYTSSRIVGDYLFSYMLKCSEGGKEQEECDLIF